MKLGFRQGDAADVVILELVDYKLPEPDEKEGKAEKSVKADKKVSAPKAEAAKE